MANKKEFKIGVIGAGAWGTALANILAQKQDVRLWAKEKSVCDNIEKHRENKRFLPKIKLSKNINCTTEINNVSECEILFLVISQLYPAHRFSIEVLGALTKRTQSPLVRAPSSVGKPERFTGELTQLLRLGSHGLHLR